LHYGQLAWAPPRGSRRRYYIYIYIYIYYVHVYVCIYQPFGQGAKRTLAPGYKRELSQLIHHLAHTHECWQWYTDSSVSVHVAASAVRAGSKEDTRAGVSERRANRAWGVERPSKLVSRYDSRWQYGREQKLNSIGARLRCDKRVVNATSF
jgi:hypothetical protein